MNRKLLILVSLLADALDMMLVGQIPGISYVIDLPVTAMHVAFAGPAGLLTLLEMVPVVGFVPIYTIAAMSYPDRKQAVPEQTDATASRP